MASSYTGLGTELMTTGENAGTWGTTTNTNLQILEQIAGGYTAQSIAGSAQTTTLSVSDGSTGAVLAHRVIEFTGTITGNQVVTVPLDVQTFYIMKNNTSGAYTVQFKYVSGSGSSVTWAATDKGTKLIYAAADHASNPNMVDSNIGGVGSYDLDGNELTLDADSDTSITASTDDQIDIEIAGADDFTFTANAFNVLTGSHATFADSANAKFGTGNDMLLYHDGTNSYITNSQGALKLATETSGIAITIGHTTSETTVADNLTVTGTLTGTLATAAQGSVTSLGTLTTLTVDNVIVNGTTIGHTSDTDLLTLTSAVLTVAGELDAATLDISGNADIDGTTNLDAVDIDGAVQIDATFTSGVDGQGYDTKFFGDTASAYMLWDTSADDLVLAGAAGIDLAGDIDVDGTANLDAVDIDGAVQIDGAVTVGVDGTGLDVKFFGDTAGSFLLWDQSDDALELTDSSPIKIGDSGDMQVYHDGTNSYITNSQGALKVATETSGIAVTIGHTTSEVTIADNLTVTGTLTLGSNAELTEAELEMLDGITAGTVAASKAVVVDSNKDAASFRNVTLTGELDAATLDISGNADIDGTTNLDAVDIDGAVQLDSTFTVGVDDTGYDVKLFGDTASRYWQWDTSADGVVQRGTLTVGVDDTGHDVKFFGATSGAYMLWDESTDDLVLAGAAKLYLYDAAGGEYLSSSGSALTIASGGTAWELPTSDGSANQLLKTDGSGNLDWTTVSGTITALNNATANELVTVGATTTELDAEANLTFDGTDVLLGGAGKLQLRDTGLYVASNADGDLDIVSDGTAVDSINLESAGGITLDAGTASSGIIYEDDGTAMLSIINSSSDVIITTKVQDKDLIIKGDDGGGAITALTIDMSAAGQFHFLDGTAALPILSNAGDTNTGLYFSAADTLSFSAGGTAQFTMADGAIAPVTDNDVDLGTTSLEFKNVYVDGTTFTDALGFGTVVMELPVADGSADQVLKTDGSGNLDWVDVAGGTSWQAVKTSNFTATAGEGYFVNTTSAAITATLPAGTIGDEVSFIDYAGTADTNNITVAANGSEKIHASTDDLTVATERAAFTLVFTDTTQGWLLKDK